MIKKYLDKIFISLGCIIIAIAILIKLNTIYRQNKLIDNYKEYISNMESEDVLFNESPKGDSESQITQNEPDGMVGILSIPKIDLTVGIGKGVDNETLKYSVGYFTETSLPGEKGNFCVIGHRSYAYGEFFNRLDEIEQEDDIIVGSNEKEFKYKVTDIKVVTPDEVSVLNQTEDSEITLITCTPIRVGSHRLIIKGVLVDN